MNQLRFIGFMEANSFALIILLIIYFNIRKYGSNKKFEQKIYSFLLFSNIAMLLVDLIRLYVDGKNDSVMYGINVVFTTIMIISTPLLPMLWTIYIDYKIFLDRVKLKRNFKYILIPSALNLLLAIVSLVGGINGKKIFSIDAENFYHRGDLYILMVLASYSYLIYSFVSLIKNKNLVDESEYKSLRMFAIPPFVGGILQSLIFGLKLTWISMALSLLIIFLYIQNNLLHVDVLTGLYNRRNLEKYLKNIFSNTEKSRTIGGVLLDINDFKHINDSYGHDEGDIALVSVAKILREGFDSDDFISRYAGDEFVVICEVNSVHELRARIDNLNKVIEDFNLKSGKPYKISMSKGYATFVSSCGLDYENFINHIDSLMYKDKERYKKYKLTR